MHLLVILQFLLALIIKDHQVVLGRKTIEILIPSKPFICHLMQWNHCLLISNLSAQLDDLHFITEQYKFCFSIVEFFSVITKTGLSVTDIVAMQMGLLINATISILSLKLMSTKGTLLTELMTRFSELMVLLTIPEKELQLLAKGIFRNSLYICFLGWVRSIEEILFE